MKTIPMIPETIFRCFKSYILSQRRYSSILSRLNSNPVLVSSNKDVYTNLALEHWLFNNLSFDNHDNSEVRVNVLKRPVVLIWTDLPCIVIGRHQNPWIETNLGLVSRTGLKLARRHSGGGCVFHDENNINISVIGSRKIFENRQENLKFLAQILHDSYGIKCEPTKRHDLIHSETGLKISGSAAKLGKFNCYHHFTMLVDTNKDDLYAAIRRDQQAFIKTNSTTSTRSKVINLKEIRNDLDVNQVINDLANAYSNLYGEPRSKEQAEKNHMARIRADLESLDKFKSELQSWEWIYGMTPKFKLEKEFNLLDGGTEKRVRITIQINKGLIDNLEIDSDLTAGNHLENFRYLIGTKFTYKEAMVNLTKLLNVDDNLFKSINSMGTDMLLATFLLQMVHDSNF